MKKSEIVILALLSFFSVNAFGNTQSQFLVELGSTLRLSKAPTDIDETLNNVFFSEEPYTSAKSEFCGLFTIPVVSDKANSVVRKFSPRKIGWYLNFNSKLAQCQTAKKDIFDTWTRQLEFNFLRFGERARENYRAEIKLSPTSAVGNEIRIARTYGAEGNNSKFESDLKNIIEKKKKTSPDTESLAWAYVFLANLKVNAGLFVEADQLLSAIDVKALTKGDFLKEEVRIVEFHNTMAKHLAEGKTTLKLPAFCSEEAPSLMRYREVEICLVADVVANKNLSSPFIRELEPMLPNLLPVQLPLVSSTLLALQDKGVSVKTDIKKMLSEIELSSPEQTMFKFITDYAKNTKPDTRVKANAELVRTLGRYSLFDLAMDPLKK